jgi:MFS family permease
MRNDATVIGLISVAHGMSHFYQLLLAPLFPFVKDELGVSYAALGFLVALFYTLSGLLQPLAGFVVDRYGARAVLLGGIAFFIAGIAVQGFATSYAMLALGAGLGGIGNSVFHPADFAILNARVSPARLGYAFSAHGVVGYVGYAVAPLFSVSIATALGWHAALLSGAAMGVGLLALLLLNLKHLEIQTRKPASMRSEARVLLAAPVVLCFAYFTVFAAGLTGLQSFGVSAMVEQFRMAATAASSALTAYLVSAALGILAGGFVATRTSRHDYVAAAGMGIHALAVLAVASYAVPGGGVAVALAVAGFASGIVAPSRDLIVRASTPPGAAGRVFGFVYSGLDVGAFATPVFYGWMLDQHLPHAVFYAVAAFTFAAMLTVLLVRVTNTLSVQHPQ